MKRTKIKPSLPENLFVLVLSPYVKTGDENTDYYYDYTQSIEEYTQTFLKLGISWKWQPVTMDTYREVINTASVLYSQNTLLFLNLCDGDEINGAPGISVVRLLEEKGHIYTGADEAFYEISTSKITMKKLFDEAGVSTPPWKSINGHRHAEAFKKLGKPIIVKPAVSGGSMGVGIRSVVHTTEALSEQVKLLNEGYRGWQLTMGGVIAESFITGPEYTTLIVGSSDTPATCIVYPPVERVFHQSLPDSEKFLSFDRLWEIYEEEKPIGDYEDFYNYQKPASELTAAIEKISLDAYCAVKGQGYGRVDIRMDQATGKLYVLEVNAQCGLSEDENFTSIGAIMRLSNSDYSNLVFQILEDAYCRKKITIE